METYKADETVFSGTVAVALGERNSWPLVEVTMKTLKPYGVEVALRGIPSGDATLRMEPGNALLFAREIQTAAEKSLDKTEYEE